jgi:CRP-like cAMP-binding protein
LDILENAITKISPLSAESSQLFCNTWKEWSVPKDHFLLREHAIADYIFFIKKGIARIYYHKKGKEITEWIATDGTFFLSISSFIQRIPSKLIIQTIAPAEVCGIHYTDLHAMAAKYHDIETLFRKMMSTSLIMSQERMESIQFETAEERYHKLVNSQPHLIQRVPLMYIASYLGVTLETLSRIRAGAAALGKK